RLDGWSSTTSTRPALFFAFGIVLRLSPAPYGLPAVAPGPETLADRPTAGNRHRPRIAAGDVRDIIDEAPGTGCERAQRMSADRPPHQSQRRQADGGGHAPHLAMAALTDRQPQPCVRHGLAEAHRRIAWPQRRWLDHLGPGRAGASIGKLDATAQSVELRGG